MALLCGKGIKTIHSPIYSLTIPQFIAAMKGEIDEKPHQKVVSGQSNAKNR
jgi:hypothetical protein